MAKKTESGTVGTAWGMSINMGNYQVARIDCWATLPATASKAKKAHKKCLDFVLGKVADEANKIYQEHEDIRGKIEV